LWLDTPHGRMGLQGARVKTVTQLDAPKGIPAPGAGAIQTPAALERVRVKTPGGLLYGKLIERDGERATVVTDDGARLTVPSKDVEALAETPRVQLKGG